MRGICELQIITIRYVVDLDNRPVPVIILDSNTVTVTYMLTKYVNVIRSKINALIKGI